MIKRIQILMLLLLFFTIQGYGYIDPGTGSYIVQIVIAMVVGAGLGIKLFWKKIKDFFSNLFGGKKEETTVPPQTPGDNPE